MPAAMRFTLGRRDQPRKYRPMFTLMRHPYGTNQVSLSVAVAGQFPGSPVTLDCELRLCGGKNFQVTITNHSRMIAVALVLARSFWSRVGTMPSPARRG